FALPRIVPQQPLPHNALPPLPPSLFSDSVALLSSTYSKRTHPSDDTPTWSPATTPLPFKRAIPHYASTRPKVEHDSPTLTLRNITDPVRACPHRTCGSCFSASRCVT
ncbi:unnamed protein product, partial [Ectocarpus sp. 12 AP-2014]